MKTKDRLAEVLKVAGAPAEMIEKAQGGFYGDFSSPLAMPITQLVRDCRSAGLDDIARRAIAGEFDATEEEAREWAESPEGVALGITLTVEQGADGLLDAEVLED